MFAIDDTTFPKQGHASVGVGRQYCGALGKVANCQTLITAEYIADTPTTQTPFHWPVTAQLFVPDGWLNAQERRRRAHIPDTVQPQTKHEVALAVIDRLQTWQVPFQIVLADAGYGRSALFVKGLEARHLVYLCGVDHVFGVRRPDEVTMTPTTRPTRTGTGGRPRKAHPAPLYVARAVVAALPQDQWQTVTWRTGSKGPMKHQFVALRMHMGTGEAGRSLDDPRVYTGPEGWLIAERPLDGTPEQYKYYFSNLAADIALEQLARYVRARWPIEQFYEDAKQECGLGDYQGRRWDGLHRHVALVMLAYSFLAYQRMTHEERAAGRFSPSGTTPVTSRNPSRHPCSITAQSDDLVARHATN